LRVLAAQASCLAGRVGIGHPAAFEFQDGQEEPGADAIVVGYELDDLGPAQHLPIDVFLVGGQVAALPGAEPGHVKVHVIGAVDELAVG
jgi:hypothetical protein